MFKHSPIELIEYQTESINGKRHYNIDGKLYPSITTVMSSIPNESLQKWRDSVGEIEADRISKLACTNGTNLHQLAEDYLKNNALSIKFPDDLERFRSIKPELDKINNILAQEKVIYSDKMKVAGRFDCLAEYNGTLSLIDFKTSRKLKEESHIQNYFQQATFYALSLAEIHNIVVKQIVILIAVEHETPQVFIKQTKDYINPLLKTIRYFYENV